MTFVAPNLACGEARGGRIPCRGAVTDEQRSHRPNSAQPGGRQVFFAQTSLLAPHRSTVGYARRSRLVWAKNPLPRTTSYLCLRPLRSFAGHGSLTSAPVRSLTSLSGSLISQHAIQPSYYRENDHENMHNPDDDALLRPLPRCLSARRHAKGGRQSA